MSKNPQLSDEGFEFYQSESLTVRLHDLTRNYPKGIGIIKEFIQNADDARANYLRIIMDWRTHPSDHLIEPAMKALMGPALLIFNDKLFTETDIESIQNIGRSAKSQSGSKTGRFGHGFNAAYNVTDYPHLLTGEKILFFDPHANVIPLATKNDPGHGWLLEKAWNDFSAVLQTFDCLGLKNRDSFFQGTAFRLPFRTKAQAQRSEICTEAFSKNDFSNILKQLITIGDELLLFLKHILSIQVYEIVEGRSEPELLLEITTENENEVQQNRDIINLIINDDHAQMLDYLRSTSPSLPSVSYRHKINVVKSGQAHSEQQIWHIISGLYTDPQNELLDVAEEMFAHEEKALPWAGAAAKLKIKQDGNVSCSSVQGSVYCFLPIVGDTKLRVHLNGFFDLDSSRQKLTSNEDNSLIGKDKCRAHWNELLAQYAVAKAYAELVVALTKDAGISN